MTPGRCGAAGKVNLAPLERVGCDLGATEGKTFPSLHKKTVPMDYFF